MPGRFYKPCVLQGFLILFTEEKLKTRMDFACVSREPRTSPARFLLRVAGIFHEMLAGHHAWHGNELQLHLQDRSYSTQHKNITRDRRGICFIHVWLTFDMTTCKMLEWMKIWIESVVWKWQARKTMSIC